MASARKQAKEPRAAPAERPGLAGAHVNGAADEPGLIDVTLVRDLIAAVDESGIDTLEISRSGIRIRISKSPRPMPVTLSAPAAAPAAAPAVAQAAAPAAPAAPGDEKAHVASDLYEVRSPMVGTFYRAPAPEAPPYVEPGTTVSRGQTLCILEAMKLMNELPSEVDGIVREIHVENGSPVEYSQLLFRIERSGTAA